MHKESLIDQPESVHARRGRKRVGEPEVQDLPSEPDASSSRIFASCCLCLDDCDSGDGARCDECGGVAHENCLRVCDWKEFHTFSQTTKRYCRQCEDQGIQESGATQIHRAFSGMEQLLIALFLSAGDVMGTKIEGKSKGNLALLHTLFSSMLPNNPYRRSKAELQNEIRLLRHQTGFQKYCQGLVSRMRCEPSTHAILENLRQIPQRNSITPDVINRYVSDMVEKSFNRELAEGSFNYRYLSTRKSEPVGPNVVRFLEAADWVIAKLSECHSQKRNSVLESGYNYSQPELDSAVSTLRKRQIVELNKDGYLFGSSRIAFTPAYLTFLKQPSKTAISQFGDTFLRISNGQAEIPAIPCAFQEILQVSRTSKLEIAFPLDENGSPCGDIYAKASYYVTDPVVDPVIPDVQRKTAEKMWALKARLSAGVSVDRQFVAEAFMRIREELWLPMQTFPQFAAFRTTGVLINRLFAHYEDIYSVVLAAGRSGLSKARIWEELAEIYCSDLLEPLLADLHTSLDRLIERSLIVRTGATSILYAAAEIFESSIPYPWSPPGGRLLDGVLRDHLMLVLHFVWEREIVSLEDIVSEFTPSMNGRSVLEITSMLLELELVSKLRIFEVEAGKIVKIRIDEGTKWMDEDILSETFLGCGSMWRSLAAFESVKEALSGTILENCENREQFANLAMPTDDVEGNGVLCNS